MLLDEPLSTELRGTLDEFRCEFDRGEQLAVRFQVNYMLARQEGTLRGDSDSGTPLRVLLMFESGTAAYSEVASQAVAHALPAAEIHVLQDSDAKGLTDTATRRFSFVRRENSAVSAPKVLTAPMSDPYDLLLLFVQNPLSPVATELRAVARKVPARRRCVIDCNFNVHRQRHYWRHRFRSLVEGLAMARQEPGLIVRQVKTGTRVVARHVLRRLNRWDRWRAGDTENAGD